MRYRDHFQGSRPPRRIGRIPSAGGQPDTFTRPVTRERPVRPRPRRAGGAMEGGDGSADDILRRVSRDK